MCAETPAGLDETRWLGTCSRGRKTHWQVAVLESRCHSLRRYL